MIHRIIKTRLAAIRAGCIVLYEQLVIATRDINPRENPDFLPGIFYLNHAGRCKKFKIRYIYTELFTDRPDLMAKDKGLGMSEEDIACISKEFHKLSARPTAGEASSGLGLSVAKKLVKQIGGEIFAESTGKNKGSTFRIGLKITPKN